MAPDFPHHHGRSTGADDGPTHLPEWETLARGLPRRPAVAGGARPRRRAPGDLRRLPARPGRPARCAHSALGRRAGHTTPRAGGGRARPDPGRHRLYGDRFRGAIPHRRATCIAARPTSGRAGIVRLPALPAARLDARRGRPAAGGHPPVAIPDPPRAIASSWIGQERRVARSHHHRRRSRAPRTPLPRPRPPPRQPCPPRRRAPTRRTRASHDGRRFDAPPTTRGRRRGPGDGERVDPSRSPGRPAMWIRGRPRTWHGADCSARSCSRAVRADLPPGTVVPVRTPPLYVTSASARRGDEPTHAHGRSRPGSPSHVRPTDARRRRPGRQCGRSLPGGVGVRQRGSRGTADRHHTRQRALVGAASGDDRPRRRLAGTPQVR